jgi:valyl-tRNA synthetase
MIENRYQPSAVETRIYEAWEAAGAFRAGRPERAKAEPYCIVIPPPNVTGSLHMGHALNNTLQDILCRFERMRGRDVLWQPGTDHAGIATQAVVERQLMERQQSSRSIGREEFIKRVWEWKAESGGTIISQLKRLGASCDWSRERFTMDEGLSRAVMKVFVTLYREGLIYKDKRLVNWDPKLKTAISDLEVQQVETRGSLWFIKYPVEGSDEFIVVATTRPETMLGDVAVAVHPENERLKHLIGKTAILPLVGRRIPIIGDDYADPEKGSGAVKITPAHDFNDFEVGRRHGLPLINVLDAEGHLDLKDNAAFLNGVPPSTALDETLAYHGFDRFAVRKKIVERLEAAGLIDKIEPTTHVVPHGDRSGAVLEPFLTDQWYVDAKTLAQQAIEAVRAGKTKFVPAQWEATFFNWMENIQPWCISRQIWWGHQIPAWYGPKLPSESPRSGASGVLRVGSKTIEMRFGPSSLLSSAADDFEVFVAESESEAVRLAEERYGNDIAVHVLGPSKDGPSVFQDTEGRPAVNIFRDPDVLDTWFSSALWPFSTLGWPDDTPELKRFYPTSALVTGFDIIFFWVARMMMMGLHFMKEVPFRDVYIHRLVRDASGAKMSKSKGNVVDPLGLIDQYGADALRFTLARGAAQGHDIRLDPRDVESNRNFATKLWNAVRFAQINKCKNLRSYDPADCGDVVNRRLVKTISKAARHVTKAVEEYRFDEAANVIYHLVWSEFCDWYIEFAKPKLTGRSKTKMKETRATTGWAIDQILKLLHPFMPFITEELWRLTNHKRRTVLALSEWPTLGKFENITDHPAVDLAHEIVEEIRSTRAAFNITTKEKILAIAQRLSKANTQVLSANSVSISRLANAEIQLGGRRPRRANIFVYRIPLSSVRGGSMAITMPPFFNRLEQAERLRKELAEIENNISRFNSKLGNADFVRRAPEEVVEAERSKLREAELRLSKLKEAIERLENPEESRAKSKGRVIFRKRQKGRKKRKEIYSFGKGMPAKPSRRAKRRLNISRPGRKGEKSVSRRD